MADPAPSDPKYHVLLIGVDNYKKSPLAGCVNDIDAVQRVLLGGRMQLAPDRIQRLASPLPGNTHETSVPEQPATLANIRAALTELGSEKVKAGDRVFIYYSGHGVRGEVTAEDGRRSHREALVPVDYDGQPPDPRVLFDHEMNQLLGEIVRRTRSVTAVLDCCYAAGATRDGFDPPDQRVRCLDLGHLRDGDRRRPIAGGGDPDGSAGGAGVLPRGIDRRRPIAGGGDPDGSAGGAGVLPRGIDRGRLAPLPDPAPRGRGGDGGPSEGKGIDDCHVVSACMNHEVAREDAQSGVQHGLFTRAFLDALDAAKEVELPSLTWGRIWQAMQAQISRHNSTQHLWMAGHLGRAVFAGPPVHGDAGFSIVPEGDGYQIQAGTLADITQQAVLAIYGEQPDYFPEIGSAEDRPVAHVRVTDAKPATATAAVEGDRFELPPGARARLVRAGEAARLPCAVVPANPDLEAALRASPLLDVVDPSTIPEVKLEEQEGRWFVTDALHGKRAGDRILVKLQRSELGRARAVLEHYAAYSRPLRMAMRIDDLQGSLELRVLRAPEREVPAELVQKVSLEPVVAEADGRYMLRAGARICFEVRNRSSHELRVTLMNSAASGKVQLLGDQYIHPQASYVFWAGNHLGRGFTLTPPPGVSRCIDRMVAIGRTKLDHELKYLQVDKTFDDVIGRTRGAGRDVDDGGKGATAQLEHWAAALAILGTTAP